MNEELERKQTVKSKRKLMSLSGRWRCNSTEKRPFKWHFTMCFSFFFSGFCGDFWVFSVAFQCHSYFVKEHRGFLRKTCHPSSSFIDSFV